MTQRQLERFIEELERRGIKVTTTDRALLGCFLQWYTYDCMMSAREAVNHED